MHRGDTWTEWSVRAGLQVSSFSSVVATAGRLEASHFAARGISCFTIKRQ